MEAALNSLRKVINREIDLHEQVLDSDVRVILRVSSARDSVGLPLVITRNWPLPER